MQPPSFCRTMIIFFGAILAVFGPGCRARPSAIYVSLAPYGSSALAGSVPALPANPNLRLFIDVSDTRSDVNKIGENREEGNPIPVTSSGAPPAAFVRDLLSREFASVGLTTVIDRGQANRVLNLSITRFFVMETGTFQAEIATAASVSDPSGKKLWTGNPAGDNGTFGRSMNPKNYQQVLTASTIELAKNLVKDAEFIRALQVP